MPPWRRGMIPYATTSRTAPRWSWARLLKRVFDLDMATCSFCQRGALRIIAAITQEAAITGMLRPLKLAAVPPIAPARSRQETFDWPKPTPSPVPS